MKKSSRQKK